ncbi:M23 family metallopeptidase [Calothrix sp. NIES-3974]|uniref:M23 family metallopeptidase n=1 Tax=Calothrix sp. NIES-3974 TaxID=2005462 RepID=UPI000B61433D|nr:M23 family metallopeptidase [Calothrix sp. NIES-3974]BAZ04092.1 peptidase M23B [Calothrix sp. NIES-3974]
MWQWYRQRLRIGRKFFILWVMVVAISIVLLSSPQLVRARQISTTSSSNDWSRASFPVENFRAYTSPFGYRRSPTGDNNWEFHNGLDIAAPRGSYIRNWWTGTVIKVSDRGACGTHIIIQSGDWQHSYCHLEGGVVMRDGQPYLFDSLGGILIREGQQIPAGVRIGRVGMTGRTTGPHLHWTIRYRSGYVDPAMVLRAMFAVQPNNRVAEQSFPVILPQLQIDELNYIRNFSR